MTREIMVDVELVIPCRVTVEISGEERAYRRAGSADADYEVEAVATITGITPEWPEGMPWPVRRHMWHGVEHDIKKRRADIEAQAIEETRREAQDGYNE